LLGRLGPLEVRGRLEVSHNKGAIFIAPAGVNITNEINARDKFEEYFLF
jgi:hypothetical protein